MLVTDLPPEESPEWLAVARERDLDTVFLAAPTSPEERLSRIAEASRGLGEAMVGINVGDLPAPHRLAERGW